MNRGLLLFIVACVACAGICDKSRGQDNAAIAQFRGWQGIRVIEQDGWPRVMRAMDLNGDGRTELIIVNARQSRLDIYRWLPLADRKSAAKADPDRPNELPMADDFERAEVPQDRLPRDVLAKDVDGDSKLELIVLQTPPNRIAVYKQDAKGKWDKTQTWDLLPGEVAGRDAVMLCVAVKDKKTPKLLISMGDGIQQLELSEGSRAKWMEPRGKGGRADWWQADLDGDGDPDLVEWNRAEKQPVRWYENVKGTLLPAAALTDEQVDDVQVMTGGKEAQLLLLGGTQSGILRRYKMVEGKPTPLGRREPLPMSGADKAAWVGIELDNQPALLSVDPNQPRLIVTKLTDNGWTEGESYPIVTNVQALAAPLGAPTGTLLLWSKDAGDLHISHWENGRFTYPKPMEQSPKVEDRKILAMATAGRTVWWVRKTDKDLNLYTWPADAKEPTRALFEGAGAKADKVVWLGGDKLLMMEQYARSPKLVQLVDGKTEVSEPTHLKKAQLDQFMLVPVGDDKLKPAKLTDGVLQWLSDALQPMDQVMLPDGLRLAAYVENADRSAWALQAGGEKIHLLKPDASGVMRLADSFDIDGGLSIMRDRVLGLMLVDAAQLVRLSAGSGHELKLLETIDSREGRPNGVKEATIHALLTTSVLGDGDGEDLVLADYRRHQLTVLAQEPGAKDDVKLTPVIGWPVYEDRAYPYGGGPDEQDLTRQPRCVVGLDIDGDQSQDLAMLCQDRLLIYLGHDDKTSRTKGGR